MNNDYTDAREPLDTKNMLEEGFLSRLGKVSKIKPKVKEEFVEETHKVKANYNTENVLIELYEARDNLISMSSKVGINSNTSLLSHSINKIGSCINALGGKVEHFDPISAISGLQSPNLVKNAHRVIENTREAYSLGNISDAQVKDDGSTIEIVFEGQTEDTSYKAVGTITTAKSWIGNEAIEYIYTPSEGRLSVKALNDEGRWIDRSANYKIAWELHENPINKAGKTESVPEIKEEITKEPENDLDDDISDDFPIEEK